MEQKLPSLADLDSGGVMALNPDYLKAMGWFQSAWSSVEVNTDFAIGALLKVTYEQAHLITIGMTFGPKAQLLAALLKNSDHPKRQAIADAFNKVKTENLRNVFAHSYIATDTDSVTFIARKRGGKTKVYEFTIDKFVAHVVEFVRAGTEFNEVLEEALDMTPNALDEFALAAWEPDDD